MKKKNLFLQIHDAGIFEQNDWDTKRKKVIFFTPEITSIALDGKQIEFPKNMEFERSLKA